MEMEGEEMENAKIDNTLNLALSVPEGERLLTEDLPSATAIPCR